MIGVFRTQSMYTTYRLPKHGILLMCSMFQEQETFQSCQHYHIEGAYFDKINEMNRFQNVRKESLKRLVYSWTDR